MTSLLARVLAGACVALALLAGWQWIRANRAQNELQEYRAAVAQQVAQAATAARAEEQRRTLKIQEAADAAEIARQSAEADARSAVSAAERLRQRAAQLATSCAASVPAAAGGSASAPTSADLLVRVLGGLATTAGELAEFADKSRIAGLACERAFNSLTPR